MINFSPSHTEVSLPVIREWYEETSHAIDAYKANVLAAVKQGTTVSSVFSGMTRRDIDRYFERHQQELDYLVSLNLIASAEASLKLDYFKRVNRKPRSKIDKALQEIYVAKAERISLEADLLGTWKTVKPACQKIISEFLGVLKLRHWLAHGRYWNAKLGRRYSSIEVYQIASDLLACLSIY